MKERGGETEEEAEACGEWWYSNAEENRGSRTRAEMENQRRRVRKHRKDTVRVKMWSGDNLQSGSEELHVASNSVIYCNYGNL